MTILLSGYASKSSGMKAAGGKSHTAYNKSQLKKFRSSNSLYLTMAKQLIPVLSFIFLPLSVELRINGLLPHVTIWWVLKHGIHVVGIGVS